MKIHFTTDNACPVGCGEALIFLESSKTRMLLLYCPSCDGMWDSTVFDPDVQDPQLYSPRQFQQREIVFPHLETIQAGWKGPINSPSAREDEYFNQRYYLKWLRSAFSDKLDDSCVPQ